MTHLANPGLVNFYQPTKDYWHRCLFWCSATGHRGGVEAALANGGSPKWKHSLVSQQTALHVAVEYGSDVETVKLLLAALLKEGGATSTQLYKMKDSQYNNPLHAFVRGTTNKIHEGDVDGRKIILEALLGHGSGGSSSSSGSSSDKKLMKSRELLESSRNRQGFRPVDYVPGLDVESIAYQLLKTKQSSYYQNIIENEPAITFEWVLVFKRGAMIEGLDTQYEKVIKKLREHDLLADSMVSAMEPEKEIFVMVGCTERMLRQHAETVQYEVQLLSSREYRKYEMDDDHLFLPFRSQERMEIIMKKIQQDIFDVDAYLECGVVLRSFPLHDPNERDVIRALWLPKIPIGLFFIPCIGCCGKYALPPFSFCRDLRKEGEYLSFEHLTALKMYFGENVAFYSAW